MSRLLIDTNVIVYMDDHREPRKRRVARGLWPMLAGHPGTTISSQVISETANTMLRLWGDPQAVDRVIANLENSAAVVPVTPSTVRLALEGVSRFGFAFYDAQIWAAARQWGASIVLSEDFTDGLAADGVRFVNPFAEEFDLDAFLGSLPAGAA